jgi:hypothetical protein
MSDLTERIYQFIAKQEEHGKVYLTHEEAQKMGLEKPDDSSKTLDHKKYPHTQKTGPNKAEIPNDRKIGTPKSLANRRFNVTDSTSKLVSTVGSQLSPKGPYSSPSDIAEDINTSRRASNSVARKLSKPKGVE